MAYSADLRNKALNYYEQCKNISQTAATFNLSRNTLYLWIRLKKQTGSLKHQVTGLNAVKLDRQKLAQYVGQHPDAYLHEIAKHFDCTPAAVCYALKQMGMTRRAVVFPAPLRPTTARHSPSASERLRPCRTGFLRRATWTPSTSRAGAAVPLMIPPGG